MPRLARIVVPGVPHHVTQRGNRRERVFFSPHDYRLYRRILAEAAGEAATAIWAYCLMPNHVHLVLVPSDPDGLRATLADAHRRYTRFINDREGWTGHLWQGRFGSAPMDEDHLESAVRYVSLNPVRAGLVKAAQEWPWSSARAHLAGFDDGVVTVRPVLDRWPDFASMISVEATDAAMRALRKAETTGRPLGARAWVDGLGAKLGKRARKPI